MNPALQRIEATLHQLESQDQETTSRQPTHAAYPSVATPTSVGTGGRDLDLTDTRLDLAELTIASLAGSMVKEHSLDLPDFNSSQTPNRRYSTNPLLAMNLLKELEASVGTWQTELHTVLQDIRTLYQEGPIVDGWLESQPPAVGHNPPLSVTGGRGSEQILLPTPHLAQPIAPSPEPLSSATAGYRLCGLNQEGQLWYRRCPAEQIPEVSLAIVRYQRLQQFLTRKQVLENQLFRLAEVLIDVHQQLNIQTRTDVYSDT